jgi:4-carboxymuconolactone decarboxylase
MDERQRARDGMARRRAVLGDAHVDRAEAHRNRFNDAFQDLIVRHAWGELWTRPGLPEATRRLLTIALMVALNRGDEFRLHVRSALEQGAIDLDTLREVLLHCTVYCGVPAGNQAFRDAQAVLDELGLEPAPVAP